MNTSKIKRIVLASASVFVLVCGVIAGILLSCYAKKTETHQVTGTETSADDLESERYISLETENKASESENSRETAGKTSGTMETASSEQKEESETRTGMDNGGTSVPDEGTSAETSALGGQDGTDWSEETGGAYGGTEENQGESAEQEPSTSGETAFPKDNNDPGSTVQTTGSRETEATVEKNSEPETTKHIHSPVVDAGYPATCTDTGLSDGSHCSECMQVIADQKVLPMIDHSWVKSTEWVPGFITCYCGEVFDDISQYDEHLNMVEADGGNITEHGNTATYGHEKNIYICEMCGMQLNN